MSGVTHEPGLGRVLDIQTDTPRVKHASVFNKPGQGRSNLLFDSGRGYFSGKHLDAGVSNQPN